MMMKTNAVWVEKNRQRERSTEVWGHVETHLKYALYFINNKNINICCILNPMMLFIDDQEISKNL